MSYATPVPKPPPYVILVGLVFDKTGEQALWEAARLAELHPGSELHVVHVVPDVDPVASKREHAAFQRRLQLAPSEIRDYVRLVWPDLTRKVIAHLRVGSASRAILETAADIGAQVVVVGTHRKSGIKKFMLGSVSEQVMQHAHCPVFVAMPRAYEPKAKMPAPISIDLLRRRAAQRRAAPSHLGVR